MGMRAEKMQDMMCVSPARLLAARRKKAAREAQARKEASQATDAATSDLRQIEEWTKEK